VVRHREASTLVLASGLRTLTRGLWTALLVVVALRMLRLGPSGVGLLSGAVGIGALAGLPLAGSMIGRSRLGKPCALSFIGVGVTVSLVGAAGVTAVIAVLAAGWGASMAVSDSTSLSLLTRLLDSPTLARTVGVMESLKLGAEGAGALLAPALVGLFGIRAALVLAGLPLPLLVTFAVPWMRRADDVAVDRGRLVSLLHAVSVFRPLDMASLETLAASRESVSVPAGDAVFRAGEPGDRFFIIETGEADVVIGGFPIGRLGPGAGFGERALLRNVVRIATIRALTPLALLAFDRTAFLYAVTGRPPNEYEPVGARTGPPGLDSRSRTVPDLLADQAPFAGLTRGALERIASAAITEHWSAGDVVIREGDTGDAIFLVLSGRAHAVHAGATLAEFLPGDCFGQISALHPVARTATVAALEPLTTCRIASDVIRSASDH
jgi:CRP-like cAMP-binding protein